MKPLALLLASLPLATPALANRPLPLRIGVADSDSAPIVELHGNTLRGGLSRKLGEALGQTLQVPVSFVVLSRKRVEWTLESGQVDIVCNSNPAWYAGTLRVGWTRELYPQTERVISRKTYPRTIDNLDALAGQRIGVIAGYHYRSIDPLWHSGRASRIDQPRLPLLMRALLAGMVDVVINSELELGAWARAHAQEARLLHFQPLVVSSIPTRCAVAPTGRYSVEQLDRAIGEMAQDGTLRRILERYQWQSRD